MDNAAIELVEQSSRSVPRRIWRGTVLLVVGRLWGSACTVFTLWLLAHHLTPDGFGRYTFYLAIFMLLDTLVDFGTGQIAVQRTAHDESAIPEVLAATRRIRVAMGVLGVVLVGGGAFVFGEPGAGWILLASLYPVTHVCELSATVFRNRIAWGIPVAARAAAAAMSLAFVLALRATGDREPAHYLCMVALGSAIANFLLHAASSRYLPERRASFIPVRDVFLVALPLGIAALCQQTYFYVDNLFVRRICGAEPLGQYNVGVRVMSYTIMVALYATQAALPWLAREHQRGELGPAVARLTQPLFALAGLGAGLLWPWTEKLLALFGPGFDAAGPSLRWLLCATTTIYAGAGLMTALVAAGKTRTILVIAAAGLATNLVANTFLVPARGIEGAGIATFMTEGVVALSAAIALVRVGVNPFVPAAHPHDDRAKLAPALGAWGWLGGPLAFALSAWASSHLPIP
jgi:O-antigen/teichoic acid export membrane protein